MSLQLAGLEKGIHVTGENSDVGYKLLFGAVAPGGTAETDGAEKGSYYTDTVAGFHYRKKDAGSGVDKWEKYVTQADINAIKFRSEKIFAVTGDAAPSFPSAIDRDTTPYGDDEGTQLGNSDHTVGEFVIFGHGGTPVLAEVTIVTGSAVTYDTPSDPLDDLDKFVVQHFLPDSPDDQEKQALVQYEASPAQLIKLGDINWSFADGIGLGATFVPANGTVTIADTVNSAIEKIVANQTDLTTLSGRPQGAVDNGVFPGTTISDNVDTRTALEELETALESIGADRDKSEDAVTSVVTLDSLLVDDFLSSSWLITAKLDSDKARTRTLIVDAHHNGYAGADATAVDRTISSKLLNGASFDANVSIDLSGVGAAQVMRLRVSASAAVSFRSRRLGEVKAQGL